jgi:hypothetical protein
MGTSLYPDSALLARQAGPLCGAPLFLGDGHLSVSGLCGLAPVFLDQPLCQGLQCVRYPVLDLLPTVGLLLRQWKFISKESDEIKYGIHIPT